MTIIYSFYSAFFNIHRSDVLMALLIWMLHSHFIRSHIGWVHVCLAVTCHLHVWQNEQDLLRAVVWREYGTKCPATGCWILWNVWRHLTVEAQVNPEQIWRYPVQVLVMSFGSVGGRDSYKQHKIAPCGIILKKERKKERIVFELN